jgi:tRNA A-37 threonylcarbamoyl transferase component Bud32
VADHELDQTTPHVVLDPETAEGYARAAGLDVVPGSARTLTGGVSSVAIAIDGRPPIVVKQALSRLAVSARWNATPERAMTEASALRLTHRITPLHVPELLLADPVNHLLVISHAPEAWRNWRDVLLTEPGSADVQWAGRLGEVLGLWHAATWGDDGVRRQFSDDLAFEQLRVDPFYREILRRHPQLAAALEPLVDEVTGSRQCLVHGDFSPKNVLVGDDGFWVLDHEVARVGAAVYDLAFLVSHLMLKAVHRPDAGAVYAAASTAFLDAYAAANPRPVDPLRLGAHAAALLLARVDGKSPVPYLTEPERRRVRDLALDAVIRIDTVEGLWGSLARDPGMRA